MRKIIIINSPASGTWLRDAILIESKEMGNELALVVDKESDRKRYKIIFHGISLYHSWEEENRPDWLIFEIPDSGSSFYQVEGDDQYRKGMNKNHYVYFTYDEAFEVFADSFSVEDLGEGKEV